jgi:hypothetical protein
MKAVFVATILLTLGGRGMAAEYLVEGFKLVIKDTSTSKKVVYISKDVAVATPVAGGVDDPTLTGATFTIQAENGNGLEVATFDVPASNWTFKQTGSGPLFKFVNRDAPAAPSEVRVVVLRSGFLKLKALAAGVTLDEPTQISMAVRFDSGASQWCSAWGSNIVKNQPGLFKGVRNDAAPLECIGSPSSAFVEPL